MSKILVTGGNGLVGSHLLFALASAGESVRALKRHSSDLSIFNKIFSERQDLLNHIEWVDGDVLEVFSIQDAMKEISHVFHCAAMVSFEARHKTKVYKVNAEGTANVVNACLDYKIEKLCYVSSVAALGRNKSGEHINEDTQWKKSKLNSNYAVSKFAAENEVWRGIAEGLNAVIVNPTVILGNGNWNSDSSVVFKRVYDGLKFYTEGVNGFVDVADVVEIMMRLMNSDIAGEKFILVSENYTYHKLFNEMAAVLKKPAPSFKAGKLLRSFAWRMEWLRSRLTGSPQVITRETAITAANQYYYSNNKIKAALNYNFKPLPETIEFCCNKLLAEQSK